MDDPEERSADVPGDLDEADPDAVEPAVGEEEQVESGEASRRKRGGPLRLALAGGLVASVAMAGTVGWLAYRTYQSHREQDQRNVMIQAGRQAALNLTTINFETADADVQRVLDSSTGSFYDDFKKRSPAFVQVVKEAKSKSVGNVTEAGLLGPIDGGQAQVLIAVSVHTSMNGTGEDRARAWRMQIGLQETKDGVKASNVEFVP
ncbi:hypothetical protein BOO86_15240 [Mycobacterium sp. CBMA 234]|nr:hypothetical protein [Mycolicibacterium sp. CBMA 234]